MKPPALQLHSRGFLYIPGKKSPYTPDSPSALFKMQRILDLMKVKFSTVLIRFRQDGQMLCTLLHTSSQYMCTPRGTSDHPTTPWLPSLCCFSILKPYCCCTSHITGCCCSMPGLPRPLVCLNSLPLTSYILAVAASLCGMAKALKAKLPANATIIPLQQQDGILSSSTPLSQALHQCPNHL